MPACSRVRPGPFGEIFDPFTSRAFAVCDHQVAHIYIKDPADIPRVRDLLGGVPGVASLLSAEARGEVGLDHPRSGEIVALAEPDAWFAYPFWLDDDLAPDYARTVDIHRKPGYDPCELFLDPTIRLPKLRLARRLLAKKLGFRTLFDVIPLDPSLVKGSHGLRADRSRGPAHPDRRRSRADWIVARDRPTSTGSCSKPSPPSEIDTPRGPLR